ncbi:MAG: nuclear transport factor 2 family protein [Gemmatimonadota bacterium]|nr:MAG: nuclear transport factor 2 family protein [Gemmatimonadota bacterium]
MESPYTQIVRGIMVAAEALDHARHMAPFDDTLVWADLGSVATNMDSIRAADREFLSSMRSVEGAFGEMSVEVLGSTGAAVTTTFEVILTDTTGTQIPVAGAATYVFTRRATGWKIVHGHRSMPLPGSE